MAEEFNSLEEGMKIDLSTNGYENVDLDADEEIIDYNGGDCVDKPKATEVGMVFSSQRRVEEESEFKAEEEHEDIERERDEEEINGVKEEEADNYEHESLEGDVRGEDNDDNEEGIKDEEGNEEKEKYGGLTVNEEDVIVVIVVRVLHATNKHYGRGDDEMVGRDAS
ncbi:hypothetical protein Sjap_013268 [Stephania japonica]|uniref:Uncharacterized protein n=1 Tax=Stephania japonica TaxID=461633 RepID=A0AAP0IXL6_9MAGN